MSLRSPDMIHKTFFSVVALACNNLLRAIELYLIVLQQITEGCNNISLSTFTRVLNEFIAYFIENLLLPRSGSRLIQEYFVLNWIKLKYFYFFIILRLNILIILNFLRKYRRPNFLIILFCFEANFPVVRLNPPPPLFFSIGNFKV